MNKTVLNCSWEIMESEMKASSFLTLKGVISMFIEDIPSASQHSTALCSGVDGRHMGFIVRKG